MTTQSAPRSTPGPKRVALVTAAEIPGGITPSDALFRDVLTDRGAIVETPLWNDDDVDWLSYSAIVIRSTWDYAQHHDAWQAWLTARENEGAAVWNPTDLMRWNSHKSYLVDLLAGGTPIVPTALLRPGRTMPVAALCTRRNWDEIVVKPVVGAGGVDTNRFDGQDPAAQAAVDALLEQGGALVQPFMPAIVGHGPLDGEWSVVYFDGRYSHAVKKTAKAGEFRIQEDHGGTTVLADDVGGLPDVVRTAADKIMRELLSPTLYARVDGVVHDGAFLLMELELVEPDVYLTHAGPDAVRRFADALMPPAVVVPGVGEA